jgi:hypothetical protein
MRKPWGQKELNQGIFHFGKRLCEIDLVIVLAMGRSLIDLLLGGIGDHGGEIGREDLGIKILFDGQN